MPRGELASEKAYRILRNAILQLELRPGEYLRESDLVSTFGLGRTPIREALHKLASEHLVELRPGSGSHVTEVTLSDVGDIFEMREAVTPLEIRSAIRRNREEGMQQLDALLKQLDDGRESYEADLEFHNHIAVMTGNEYLTRTMEMLNAHSIRMFRQTRAPAMSLEVIVEQHRELGQAIMSGEESRAIELALAHLHDSKKRLLESL